jgi:putative ABC transport system permease protein
MFLPNFRIAIAWAMKQPLYYAIKMLGLALGIMAVALLIAYVDFVKSYDSHIANSDKIYRLVGEYISRENGDRVRYDFGSNAWVEPFKREYAGQYTSAAALVERNGILANETQAYDQQYFFAEQDALALFNIELLQGDATSALVGPHYCPTRFITKSVG